MSDSMSLLTKALGMLGSAHDGEVLNAARLAEKTRVKLNKSWQELVSGKSPGVGPEYLMRAMRAEKAVADLELRIVRLESELRAAKVNASTSSGPSAKPKASKPKASSEHDTKEDKELVERLREGWVATHQILLIMGWKTRNIRNLMTGFANRRGLYLEVRAARGSLRFRVTN